MVRNILETNPVDHVIDAISEAELRSLAGASDDVCVSMLMPMERKGPQTRQNPVQLRNLLRQAEELLAKRGSRIQEAADLLSPASQLVEQPEFWQHQAEGLAIFISSAGMRTYRVPAELQPRVIIGRRFHLKPLFPLLSGNEFFHVLAVGRSRVRMLRCTRHSMQSIEAPEFEEGEQIIRKYIEELKSLQRRMNTGPGRSEWAGNFHGHGDATVHDKDRLFEYFRKVATTVRRLTRGDQRTPVVFAGVEYFFPIFKQANNNDMRLVDDFVPGSPDAPHVSDEDLHRSAWSVVSPLFDQARQKAFDLYREAAGASPARATNDLADALRTAHDGRAAVAFVAQNVERWGRYDPASGRTQFHATAEPDDEDLLDSVASMTFLHGGIVHVVPAEEMPDRSDVAVITRF